MKYLGSSLSTPKIAILGFLFVFFGVPNISSASYPVTINSNGDICVTSSDPVYWTPIGNTTANVTSNIPPNSTFSCGVLTIFSYMGATVGVPIDLYAYTSTSTTNDPSSYHSLADAIALGLTTSTWHYDGSIVTATPPPTTDGATITSPTATTYYSNPLTFSGTYTNGSGFDQMTFDLVNTTYNQQVVFSSLALLPSSVVDQPWSFTENLYLNGNYDLKARLYNSTTGSTTPWSSTVSFGLSSTSTDPLVAPTGTSTPVITCDSNSGYFQNSFCNLFVYLFSPSADVFNRFNTLKDDLKDHAPFGYFTSAYNALSTLSGSSTPTFALAEVTPIMTYIFNPLKTGLSWLIWIVALIFIYKRLTNIHI